MDKTNSMLENLNAQGASQREHLISQLGIFELRGLAREVGVPSPTTRKRDELVSLILDRLQNNSQVPQQLTKKGRPVKKLNNLSQIMSAMTGKEENFQTGKRIKPYEEVISFAQEVPIFSMIEDEEQRDFEGVFRFANKVGYFLDVKNRFKVFVPNEIGKKYALQTGDFLSVTASKMNSSNQYIVSKINAINFEEVEKYSSVLQEKNQVISYQKLKYGQFQIYQGRRNVVEYKHNVYEDERFVEFTRDLIGQGFIVVVLGLNTSFEDAIMLSSLPEVINLTTRYAESVQDGLDKVVDAISLVQRLGQTGKKVVLFVNDIIELLNTLDLCFEEKEKIMGHLSESVVITQKLISCARAYQDESGVTIVMTYRDYNKDDNFLINEVFKVSNRFE